MTCESPLSSLDDLAARVPDGAKLAVPRDITGPAMAATRALIRRGVRGLHLVCVPTSGLQADLLIGAGCVATLETSAVTLGEFGPAPRFTAAVKAGAIALKDATCPAIHAGLQAAEKGIPFMPLRGVLGSDLVAHRPDWRVIQNPFAEAGATTMVTARTTRSWCCPRSGSMRPCSTPRAPTASATSGSGRGANS